MIATRSLHSSRHALLRAQLRALLAAADLLGAALIGAYLWVALTPLNAGIWMLSAFSAWALTVRRPPALRFGTGSRAWLAPALAVLVCLLLGSLHGQLGVLQGPPAGTCLLLSAVWSGGMLLGRRVASRLAPPFTFGVVPGAEAGVTDAAVRFVTLRHDHPQQLDTVDGLLIDPHGGPAEWTGTIVHAMSAGVPVWTRPALQEELQGKVPLDGLLAERLSGARPGALYAPAKRVLDVTATLLAAPLLLPVCALVALVVLLDAGAPVLFFQRRVGQDGRVFTIAKFRTMRQDSEAHGAAFATQGDARVTRLGALLRKFRLDELPQFWNVLKGEMSIIGPRPEQQGFVQDFESVWRLYGLRHRVRPGITGWAQVRQGYAAGGEETLEKLRYDLYYIKHVSLALDLQVVALTVKTVLTGFGAR